MKNKRKIKKKKKSLKSKFFKIVFSILTVYFVGVVGFFVYAYVNKDDENSSNNNILNTIANKIAPKLPEYTLGIIATNDDGDSRSDSIVVVGYNSVNNQITTLNIPRDTIISIPDEWWPIMVENYPIIEGDNKDMKQINVLTYYGNERGMEFLEKYVEDLLDIEIDYYAHFDLAGFRYLIDSIGGVEFDVPMRMKYSDPSQNLYIDLQPGLQVLDGDKAEQLLRFRKDNYNRGYRRGDLERIEVQQSFIKAFLKKASSIDTILSNPKAYYDTLTKHVDTNFGLSDALKYVGEIKKLDIENINTYTIPNTPYGDRVKVDPDEAKAFAYEIFKAPTVKPEDIVYEDSFNKSIQVLNGSYTKGFASKTKELLESNGYIVGNIGDSKEPKASETKIYVASHGQGNDLQKFFKNSKIIVNKEKVAEFDYDITIVLGKDDELNENIENTESTEDTTN